jgi:hypothetical protein
MLVPSMQLLFQKKILFTNVTLWYQWHIAAEKILEWVGHVVKMDHERILKIFESNPEGRRRSEEQD